MVDFIYFSLIDFPVFNVADIYVTTSMILLFIAVLFYYKDEDFQFLKMEERKMKRICLQTDPSWAGERIDKFLAEVMEDYSRSFLQKQFKEGNITVNGKAAKASLKVAEDDEVVVFLPENQEPDIEPENIPLDILYEDDQLLVVNKPKGMVVHPVPVITAEPW